jgi:hypothetical protein
VASWEDAIDPRLRVKSEEDVIDPRLSNQAGDEGNNGDQKDSTHVEPDSVMESADRILELLNVINTDNNKKRMEQLPTPVSPISPQPQGAERPMTSEEVNELMGLACNGM